MELSALYGTNFDGLLEKILEFAVDYYENM